MKCIVSLSGGRDSATCLGLAVERYGSKNVYCMGFEYGSTHPQELERAKKIAEYYNVPYQIVSINPDIFKGSTCTMLKGSTKEIQKGKTYEEILSEKAGKVDTYVPFRNGLFSAYIAARAESLVQEFDEDVVIMLGQHADDSGYYVDENGVEHLDETKAAYPDAVAKGSKILMADGTLKNIEDIKVGDKIYSFNQNTDKFEVATVTAFYNKGIKKIYNAAANLWVSKNHIMQVRGNRKIKFAPYSSLNRKNAHYKLPCVKYDLYQVENISDYNKGYLHGFIDGDGWYDAGHKKIGICQKYTDVINEIIDIWKKEYDAEASTNILSKKTPYDYDMMYTYLGKTKEIVDKFYNDASLTNNSDYYLGYLNGIMIAEGWCSYNKADKSTNFGFCQSTIKNPGVCEKIEEAINHLNIKNINWVDKKAVKSWRFNKAYRFPLVYGASKKQSLIKSLTEHYSLNHLGSIEMAKMDETQSQSKEAECYDITTTSGTFIADNVLVHNCSVSFVKAFEKVVDISSVHRVHYEAPFVKNHKWELIKCGLELKKPVPYELCLSCYDPVVKENGDVEECFECATCLDVISNTIKALENLKETNKPLYENLMKRDYYKKIVAKGANK